MLTVKEIMKFVIDNDLKVAFPGWFDLPDEILEQALKELDEKGTQKMIKKYIEDTQRPLEEWQEKQMRDVIDNK